MGKNHFIVLIKDHIGQSQRSYCHINNFQFGFFNLIFVITCITFKNEFLLSSQSVNSLSLGSFILERVLVVFTFKHSLYMNNISLEEFLF